MRVHSAEQSATVAQLFAGSRRRTTVNWGILLAGLAAAALLSAVVYYDARSVPVSRPRLLASAVFLSLGGAATLAAVFPEIPPAGLLVVAMIGPAVYLFEREDARRGEETLDPHSLPSGGDDEGNQKK